MSSSLPKTIVLKTEAGRYDEVRAGGNITPGHLLQEGATAVVHSTAGGRADLVFAREDALQGKTISDVYESGDLVPVIRALPGDEIYGWLASGENASAYAELTSNGDGSFAVAGAGDEVIATALEAVNAAAGAARIKVRVGYRGAVPAGS